MPVTVSCDGERMMDLVMVDRRVLVMGSANGAIHLVIEKPLRTDQIERFQARPKDMKFYHGETTGVLGAATRRPAASHARSPGAAGALSWGSRRWTRYVFRGIAGGAWC